MIAPWMGGKRKARGAPNGGSIGATSNAAIAAQTPKTRCNMPSARSCTREHNLDCLREVHMSMDWVNKSGKRQQ